MNINSHYCEKVFTQNANRRSRSMRKCVHGECETPFTMHANTQFELRERKFGYILYYTFDHGRVVLLLYAGDKSSQKRDIKKAKEILKNYRSKSNEN